MVDSKPNPDVLPPINCVLVGDGSVGKTCMLTSYTTDKFPTDYVPTIFENTTAQVSVDQKKITLSLWDTAGQEDYNELRQLSYPQAHVFIIVFSVIEPSSLENALKKWLPELNEKNPNAPKLIAGNKIDLRDENLVEKDRNVHVLKSSAEKACADRGCKYIECSALTQEGLKIVFDEAIRSVLKEKEKGKGKDKKRLCCKLI